MGRSTKLTPGIRDALLEAVRAGLPFERACHLVGIAPATAYQWIARGEGRMPERPATPVFVEFAEAVKSAEVEAEKLALDRIREAAEDGRQWTAAAWYLERRHPERWRKRETIEQERVVTDSDLQDFLRVLLSELVQAFGVEHAELVMGVLQRAAGRVPAGDANGVLVAEEDLGPVPELPPRAGEGE
jgi:hypothetical protein